MLQFECIFYDFHWKSKNPHRLPSGILQLSSLTSKNCVTSVCKPHVNSYLCTPTSPHTYFVKFLKNILMWRIKKKHYFRRVPHKQVNHEKNQKIQKYAYLDCCMSITKIGNQTCEEFIKLSNLKKYIALFTFKPTIY